MSTGNKRIEYFDILKGIAIYLVVMGHVITMCIRGIDSSVSFKLIGEIHMPIFFFISGYFSYRCVNGSSYAAPDLVKRFKQLIIPFFVVSSLWITYFPHSGLQSPLSSSIPVMLTTYWKDGYWFTLSLFELILVYAGIRFLLSRNLHIAVEVGIVVVAYVVLLAATALISNPDNNFDPVGIGLTTRFFPVFMMGVFANRYKDGFRRLATGNISFALAIAVFFVTWYYSVYPWEFPSIHPRMIDLAQPVMHAALMLVVFGIVFKVPDGSIGDRYNFLRRWFIYLGNQSLGVYLLHYFSLFPLFVLQEPLRMLSLDFIPVTVVAMIVAFFVVLATLGVNYIISQNKILSFLLIGK